MVGEFAEASEPAFFHLAQLTNLIGMRLFIWSAHIFPGSLGLFDSVWTLLAGKDIPSIKFMRQALFLLSSVCPLGHSFSYSYRFEKSSILNYFELSPSNTEKKSFLLLWVLKMNNSNMLLNKTFL